MDYKDRELAEFERKLQVALLRKAAPVGMKQRVLARARARRQERHGRWWMLQRVAASIVLAAMFGGFAVYRQAEERRKGEEAREQVMTALRIANKALDHVNDRLADSSR